MTHITKISTPEVSRAVLIDALVSARNELIVTKAALIETKKQAQRALDEAGDYRKSLNWIKNQSDKAREGGSLSWLDQRDYLMKIWSETNRILLWKAQQHKRTWRDRIAAWWMTWRARGTR